MQSINGVVVHVEVASTCLIYDEVRDCPWFRDIGLDDLHLGFREFGQQPFTFDPAWMDQDETQGVRRISCSGGNKVKQILVEIRHSIDDDDRRLTKQ